MPSKNPPNPIPSRMPAVPMDGRVVGAASVSEAEPLWDRASTAVAFPSALPCGHRRALLSGGAHALLAERGLHRRLELGPQPRGGGPLLRGDALGHTRALFVAGSLCDADE